VAAGDEPSPANSALAQSLFEQGRALMDGGNYALACDRFAESQRLDPSGGTLLNLAVCHEKQGRIATAYVEFSEASSLAVRDGRKDRETLARERVAALGPILPRVHVSLAEAPPPGLALTLDGSPLAREAALPGAPPLEVDPGAHRLRLSAPGRKERVIDVVAPQDGAPLEILIPALAPSQDVAQPAPAVLAPAPEPRLKGKRTAGWVTGGLGVAALGVGTGFGIDALVKQDASNAVCPTSRCSDPAAVTKSEQATTSAWVADVAIGAGVIAVGVGLYLVLTSPSSSGRARLTGRSLEVSF
jgi:hypothetical protein